MNGHLAFLHFVPLTCFLCYCLLLVFDFSFEATFPPGENITGIGDSRERRKRQSNDQGEAKLSFEKSEPESKPKSEVAQKYRKFRLVPDGDEFIFESHLEEYRCYPS